MRELRAITDALLRHVRAASATARSPRRRSSTRTSLRARRRRRAAGLPRVRRPRRGAGAARRHDGADRARSSATRYAAAEPPLRFCYFAHAYRAVRPHRGQMREFLQAGIELVGAPGAAGHGRGADGAVPRARRRPACAATGSASATPRSIPALLRGLRRRPRRRASGCCTSSPRATSSGSSARSARSGSTPSGADAAGARAAAARRRRRARGAPAGRWPTRSAACATCSTCSSDDVAARVIFDLGLAPRLGLLHGRRVRRLRPRARRAARRRRALRRPARALRAPAAGGRLRARRRPAARRAGRARSATRRPRVNDFGLTIAVPRGALFDETLDAARRPRHRHRARCARNDRKLLFERRRHRDDAPVRRADLRRGRRRRHRHHRQGRADGAVASARSSSCSTSASAAARWCSPPSRAAPTPPTEALRRLGVMRVATKYPRIAAALLRAHRPPGRDRRGQGLGRARAADRAGRGDRRPHRHRARRCARTASSCARRSRRRRRG